MMRALRFTDWSMGDPTTTCNSPIIPANNQYLGSWVNSADERVVMWLLHLGVPCFIIHEYRDGLDFSHAFRSAATVIAQSLSVPRLCGISAQT